VRRLQVADLVGLAKSSERDRLRDLSDGDRTDGSPFDARTIHTCRSSVRSSSVPMLRVDAASLGSVKGLLAAS
jgi:hypothetical protein